ncbi:MAG: thioredoxin domain-containing protein, partial [Myxococcales bacterium]|nr:thioredoxin domain-containing protein [Myxococcales bacterium]
CTEMARGGLYDHVGGGFHRYTVDDHWGIPHFEKMLYDEGQLLRVYVETWRRTRARPGTENDDLVWPIRESVDFLRREMTAEDGGWFASQDADSEGEEGTFYVWTPEQVEGVLGADRAHTFCTAYSVTQRGNFEHGTSVLQDVARETRKDFAEERRELLKARASRVAPGTDTKRVASWNAYTISGLARAGSLLGDASMLDDAIAAADFVFEKMTDDTGRLLRVFNQGRAHVPAFLDDVASLLEACLDLYRAGAGARFAGSALRLADDVAARFFDAGENDLFLTPNDADPLAIRPRSDHDGATPHSCGLAVLGLLRVASLSGRSDLDTLARGVLDTHAASLERGPESLPTLSRAALLAANTPSTAVILGAPEHEQTVALATAARLLLGPMDAVVVVAPGEKSASYLDPAWLLGRNPVNDAPTAYVCRGTACTLPVNEPAKLALLDDTTRSGV